MPGEAVLKKSCFLLDIVQKRGEEGRSKLNPKKNVYLFWAFFWILLRIGGKGGGGEPDILKGYFFSGVNILVYRFCARKVKIIQKSHNKRET